MDSWRTINLAEVVTLQRGHDLPSQERGEGEVPIIGSFGITGTHDEAKYQGPGVAIGRSGSIGVATYCKSDYWPLNTCLFVKNFRGNDPRWVYYLLDSIDFTAYNSGSAQPSLNRNYLANIRIALPTLPEQRAIAEVLGALDDKIESNRRIVEMVDSLVPNLFRSICTPTNDFELLPEVAEVQKGISYRSADLADSSTAMVTLKSFDRNGGYRPDGLKPYTGDFKPAQEMLPGELAVAQTDLTQGAEVVGRVIRIPPVREFSRLVASLDLAIVRPKEGYSNEYLYGVVRSDEFREHCRSRTSGTTVLHLGKDALPTFQVPKVSRENQERFTETARPLFELQDSMSLETVELVQLRDTLLPDLLSGRIRVPLAAEFVEAS